MSYQMFTLFLLIGCFTLSCTNEKPEKITNEQAFTQIYNEGLWGTNELGEGYSGEGSKVETAAPYMDFLQNFLQEKKIKSVVDVGCGDWQFSRHIDWEGIQYTGIDVVKSVIKRNNSLFGKETITFIHHDAVGTKLPKADLLVCKDVMQHLTNKDIQALCEQLSKYKYCLITNDIINPTESLGTNEDISNPGGCRTLDLTLSPFNVKATKVFSYPVPLGEHESVKEVLLVERNGCVE